MSSAMPGPSTSSGKGPLSRSLSDVSGRADAFRPEGRNRSWCRIYLFGGLQGGCGAGCIEAKLRHRGGTGRRNDADFSGFKKNRPDRLQCLAHAYGLPQGVYRRITLIRSGRPALRCGGGSLFSNGINISETESENIPSIKISINVHYFTSSFMTPKQ